MKKSLWPQTIFGTSCVSWKGLGPHPFDEIFRTVVALTWMWCTEISPSLERTDYQLASLRPCLWRTHQPSLAACSWAHHVQSCHPPTRLCTRWPVHLRCRPSKSPRTSLFLQRLPCPASGSPLHCWQPSIFGCWPSGVELPATGGYVAPSLATFRIRL